MSCQFIFIYFLSLSMPKEFFKKKIIRENKEKGKKKKKKPMDFAEGIHNIKLRRESNPIMKSTNSLAKVKTLTNL